MTSNEKPKPTKADLLAAAGNMLPDIIAPNLRVLICGINPGLYSGYTGHHFARPGNRFWPTLYASGFTDRLLKPGEEQQLLTYGLGLTTMVSRATATADELTTDELIAGAERLRQTVEQYTPRVVAILGIIVYRAGFKRSKAAMGKQPEPLGPAQLWVLPNPSGLNAHFTPAALAKLFTEFREEIETDPDALGGETKL